MVDIKKCADIQVRDWQLTIIKNKEKAPIISENIKSEKIDWEITQQKQWLTEILEKLEKNLNLPDAEKDENISEISIKLEQNIKKIQENINWKKENLITQAERWSYNL